MGLLILGALVIAVAIFMLIGLLVVSEDLFSESVFRVPEQPSEVTRSQAIQEDRSAFPSRGR